MKADVLEHDTKATQKDTGHSQRLPGGDNAEHKEEQNKTIQKSRKNKTCWMNRIYINKYNNV